MTPWGNPMSSADSAMLPRIHKAWSHAPAATWIRRHEPVKGRIGVSRPGGGAVQAQQADESLSGSLKHNVTLYIIRMSKLWHFLPFWLVFVFFHWKYGKCEIIVKNRKTEKSEHDLISCVFSRNVFLLGFSNNTTKSKSSWDTTNSFGSVSWGLAFARKQENGKIRTRFDFLCFFRAMCFS